MNVFDILSKVYGARGIPFPNKPLEGSGSAIANGFKYKDNTTELITDGLGSYIKEYTDESLGQYVFMPVSIDGYKLSHPLIIISGEKQIIETDLVEVGTVFEKVFTKPYDITIITTLVGVNKAWPQQQYNEIINLWKKDDVVTVKSAITNPFLQPTNNMLITKISLLENDGAESVEIVQIDGRSNVDFELIIE